MSAVRWEGHGGGRPMPARGHSFASRFVLPRLLRRPVRIFARLIRGDFQAPRYAASTLTAALFAATGLYGAWIGGHMPALVQGVTARTGFAVEEVRVSGNTQTSEIDILQAVGLDGFTSLIGFDVADARSRIATLPWVESAAVRKIYPASLEIKLVERQPFAIWQHGRELTVVERDGKSIVPFAASRHANLPLVIGLGAASDAQGFVSKVEAYPKLASRVRAYVRIADRRWDLRLDNGVTVKLPAEGEDEALADLVALDQKDELLSRDIAAVDMRLSDRLVVQLSPAAATARDELVKDMLKATKKAAEKQT